MNFIAIKSKLNNVSLLNGFTSNPRHDTSVLLEGTMLSRVTVNIYFTIHDCISLLFPIHALFTGQFTRHHAKPLPDPDLTGTGGEDL